MENFHEQASRSQMALTPNDRKYNNLRFSVIVDHSVQFLVRNTAIANFSTKTEYFFKFLWPVNNFFGYLLITDNPVCQKVQQIFFAVKNAQYFYRTIQILLYSLNLILVSTLLKKHQKHKISLTDTILYSILKNFSIFTRLNLFLTSFLLYFNFQENILAMAIATFVAAIESVFIENCCLKKEENYLTSALTSLILRSIIVSNVLVNSLIITKGKSDTIFYESLACFGAITLVWYLKGGSKLFLHRLPKTIMRLCSSIIISSGVESLIVLVQQSNQSFDFIQCFLAFTIVSCYLYFHEETSKEKLTQIGHDSNLGKFKDYECKLTSVQQEAEVNVDKTAILIGIIRGHQFANCANLRCWSNTNELYDPYLKHNFDQISLTKEKDSALKFYLKCLYQTCLKQNKSKDLMIDYCQFMVTEFGDYSTYCLYLAQLLSSQELTLLQKIKVFRLRVILEEKSANFNKTIFGGRVQMMEILNADLCFNQTIEKISNYCEENANIWQIFTQPNINLTQIRSRIQENLQSLSQIDEKWKKISPFFYAQKQWKYVYLNYYFYLKNHKVKSKELRIQLCDITNNVSSYHSKFLLHRQKIFNDKMSDSIFFDKQSTIFLTQLKNNHLLFSKIGKSFKYVLNYSEQQVIGSSLSLIIPHHIRQQHHQKFTNWLETGQSANEKKYYGKISEVIKKDGKQSFALVFYKIYIGLTNQQGLINFACLINTNEQIKKHTEKFRKRTISYQISKGQPQMTQEDYAQSLSHQIKATAQHNIFMKDEQLQPIKHNPELNSIKVVLRVLTLCFVVFCLITGFVFYNGLTSIQTKGDNYQLLLTFYRYPIGLTTSYLSNYLYISSSSSNSTKIVNQISSMLATLNKTMKNPTSVAILADQSLNVDADYAPYSVNSINRGITYDQIDLFYVIYSSLGDLQRYKNSSQAFAAFTQLDSYLKPSFDTLANKTKIQYNYLLQTEIDSLKTKQIYYIVAISVLGLLGALLVCWKYYEYQKKMRDFLDIIAQFDSKYTRKGQNYWKVIQNKFTHFHLKYLAVSTEEAIKSARSLESRLQSMSDCIDFIIQQKNSTKKDQTNEVKLSMKRKRTFISTTAQHSLYQVSIVTVFVVALMSIMLISLRISNMNELSKLQNFQNQGFNILRHYPNNEMLSYALLNRYYNQVLPNETNFDSLRFSDTFSTFYLMTQYNYLASNSLDSLFYTKYKNYFFGNPCTYNSSILVQAGFTIQQCSTWGKNTFSNGISVYMRYLQQQLGNYLIFPPGAKKKALRKEEVMTISSGLSLVSYYIEDLINTWFDEFDLRAQTFKNNDLTSIILVALLVSVIHFVVFQILLFVATKKDYRCLQQIYQNFVPEEILVNQKLIKQEFYLTGIIS